jgi:hypothetical protein
MIIINSFPRTGNRNLLLYMKFMFKIEKLDKNQQIFHNQKILGDSSIKQIVILRHPRETIISFAVLKDFLKNKPNDIEDTVNHWIDYHEEVLKNIDRLYPFFFEQTIKDPIKCLIKLSEMLSITRGDDFEAQKFFNDKERITRTKPKHVKVSSRVSDQYSKFEKAYEHLSPETHVRLNHMYEELSVAFSKRQAYLDIVV